MNPNKQTRLSYEDWLQANAAVVQALYDAYVANGDWSPDLEGPVLFEEYAREMYAYEMVRS